MESRMKTNLQFADLLNEWDPYQLKNGSYDTEIADTIQAVYELNDAEVLANRIQSIYEYSFEKTIPMNQCLTLAKKLLIIKAEESCSI